jgi:two-component system, NarL family, response regulator LiaR
MTKVAIIEDLVDYRNGIVAMLDWTDELTCVGAYESSEVAMQYLEAVAPDICLCDIGLPGINGIELVKWMKEKLPQTLCLMCTAYDEDEKVFQALEAGAYGYILKSTQPGRIIEAIEELRDGGSPMSSEIARKVLLRMHHNTDVSIAATRESYLLTTKEKEILELLAKGLLYKEIANAKGISIETVKRHCYNIYTKMHVNNRTEAINKFYNEKS